MPPTPATLPGWDARVHPAWNHSGRRPDITMPCGAVEAPHSTDFSPLCTTNAGTDSMAAAAMSDSCSTEGVLATEGLALKPLHCRWGDLPSGGDVLVHGAVASTEEYEDVPKFPLGLCNVCFCRKHTTHVVLLWHVTGQNASSCEALD